MLDLINSYSAHQIVIFLVLLVAAIKEVIDMCEFFYDRIRKFFDKEYKRTSQLDEISKAIEEIRSFQINKFKEIDAQLIEFKERQIKQEERLDLLTESDRDNIKSFLVEKYHECIEKGWVDDFTLDVIEKRFTHYEAEGGNSYVYTLMKEMRRLPKSMPQDK